MPVFMKLFPDGYNYYVTYVHNNWVLLLLVAAMLEIYTTHRISSELAKEAKNSKSQCIYFKLHKKFFLRR